MASPARHFAALAASILVFAVAAGPVAAQATAGSGSDRSFFSFMREAAMVDNQWWEGAVEYFDLDATDGIVARGIIALHPYEGIEFGGSVGFGSTDARAPLTDGSGATDLDLFGKYLFKIGKGDVLDFAVGGMATIPTGDDAAGLGYDSFAFAPFVSMRHRSEAMIINANVGVRFNEDGQIQGVPLNGETSPFFGASVIYPLSDVLSLVGEASVEAERFTQLDTDARVLGGVNWQPGNRGIIRGAVTIGLTDSAPDFAAQASYVYQF